MGITIVEQVKVQFISSMGDDLTPVNAARISFGKSTDVMTEKDEKLIQYLAKHQHMTPFEHQTLTVIAECPLFIRSQIHRHRTFAYNEVSRRYTDDGIEFYVPPVDDIRQQSKSNKQGSAGPVEAELAQEAHKIMQTTSEACFEAYLKLLDMGIAREQARSILPQNLMTRFYMTGNLRNWAHFLALRLDAHAQKEAQAVAQQVQAIIKERWPVSYEAIMNAAK